MNKTNTKRFIKQFGFARDAYFKIREATRSYDIPEICEINIRKSMLNEEIRVNLVVPSVNQEHVFGGISTALSFFDDLKNEVHSKAMPRRQSSATRLLRSICCMTSRSTCMTTRRIRWKTES